VRSQFEAFLAHSTNAQSPSTGTIYWQMNKGWPSLLWNLYNSDYDQAGSYFGAQKANEGVHALFATDTNTVDVDNLTGKKVRDLSVEAKVYGLDGTLLDDQVSGNLNLDSQGMQTDVLAPNVPAATAPPEPEKTYFVEILLRKGDRLIDRNVYLAVDAAGPRELGRHDGQAAGDDEPVRRPYGPAEPASRGRHGDPGQPSRARRARDDGGHDNQHV
jgi:exo-1,4-beta-D-glucosaminidase